MVTDKWSSMVTAVFHAPVSILLFLCSDIQAQDIKELAFIINSYPVRTIPLKETTPVTFDQTSEIKLFLIGGLRMYQIFLSSQDLPVCIFTPSCSRFSLKAIQEFGIVRGALLTSDRLQRCNGLAIQYYHIDRQTGKAIDPVEKYSFDKK